MSLDLNKLANKLDEALKKETSETLTKFLNDKTMSNNKQTAMQELLEWVRKTLPMDLDFPQMIESKIESLIPMEKKQHENTWFDSTKQFDNAAEMTYKEEFDNYYNETYGGNK